MQGKMNTSDIFGTNLQNSHPFSFNKVKDSPDLAASVVAKPYRRQTHRTPSSFSTETSNARAVTIRMSRTLDKVSLNFLVRNNSGGALCLSCHGTLPRTVNNAAKPVDILADERSCNNAEYNVACSECGPYIRQLRKTHARAAMWSTMQMARHGCCGVRLQRWPIWIASTQNCITCHNGNNNIIPALPNVAAEFAKTSYHPFPTGSFNNYSA